MLSWRNSCQRIKSSHQKLVVPTHQTNILLTSTRTHGRILRQHRCRSSSYSICISFHHSSSTAKLHSIRFGFFGKIFSRIHFRNAMNSSECSMLFSLLFSSSVFAQVLNSYLLRKYVPKRDNGAQHTTHRTQVKRIKTRQFNERREER